jgi:uncharacterized membrane protein YphA (DoxX/SURF4 family)
MKIKTAWLSTTKVRVAIVLLLRLVVGGLFAFSGLAKAIDPWGGLYKINEYFSAVHMAVSHETAFVLACVLACAEFVLGVLLLLGSFRRAVAWLLALFMLVMTPLTLWIYISNPVADCGCFGDALVLSNGATFAKNVVLCVLVTYLCRYNNTVRSVYHYRLQWLVLVASAFYAVSLSMIGYFVQPVVDFRPFKVDTDLSEMLSTQASPKFVYEKNGEHEVFSADSLPGDDWTFVERLEPQSESADLAIFDGEDDVTEDLLDQSRGGGLLLLCVAHPDRYGISRSRMANRIYDIMQQHDGSLAAVVSAQPDSVAKQWIKDVEANYPVYTADDTDIKSLARGDAALVYIKDGIIKWKYNVYALSPEIKSKKDALSADDIVKLRPVEKQHILLKLTAAYISVLCFIWLITALPLMLYRHHRIKNKPKVQLDE